MAGAPDKIWLRWEPGKAITQGPLTEHPDYTEYTLTDVDAQAALEKVKREARNEALREAAELAFEADDCYLARNAILALMEDTDDE